jgi:hypothetical protein
MRRIVCEDCKRQYDYDKDEFCPRCGAFNQPVKVWGTDSQGNIRRVDGVNEQNHAASFVHSEVHAEKRERRAKGMDPSRPARPQKPPVQQRPQPAGASPKKDNTSTLKVVLWIIATVILVNFLLPLLMALLW